MTEDPFKEYIKLGNNTKKEKVFLWRTAIGLQDVDNLKPSKYLLDKANDNIEGKITLDEVMKLIDEYYEDKNNYNISSMEADKVSIRICRILSEPTFSLTKNNIFYIHKYLFDGIYDFAGKARDYNISKKEWVLNGESVLYGSYYLIDDSLEYDLNKEREFNYSGLAMDSIVKHLASFIGDLWQIHPFGEGNTRTMAVFLIQYLRYLGFKDLSDSFSESSWYFRNALVRANYNSLSNNIASTTKYLELFLRNLLLGESNELKNRYLHIDYDSSIKNKYTSKTERNINSLKAILGNKEFFTRADVMNTLAIKEAQASTIIKRLKEANLITVVIGMGKGHYKFNK